MNGNEEQDIYYQVQNYDTLPYQQSSSHALLTDLMFAKVGFHGVNFYCNDNYTLVSYKGQFYRVVQGDGEFICNYKKGIFGGQLRLPIPNNFLSVEIFTGKEPIFRFGEEVITIDMLKGCDPSKPTEKVDTKGVENPVDSTANVNENHQGTEFTTKSVDQIIDNFDYKEIIEENKKEEYKKCLKEMNSFASTRDLSQEKRDIEALKNMSINQQISCTTQSDFIKLIEISISSIVFSAAAKLGVDFIDSYNLQNSNLKTILSTAIGWTAAYLNVPEQMYRQNKKWVYFGVTFGAFVFAIFDNSTGGNWTYDYILKYFINNMEAYQTILKVAKESFDKGNNITVSHIRDLMINTLKSKDSQSPLQLGKLSMSGPKVHGSTANIEDDADKVSDKSKITDTSVFQLGGQLEGHTCESKQEVNIVKPYNDTIEGVIGGSSESEIKGLAEQKTAKTEEPAKGSIDEQQKRDKDVIGEQWKQFSSKRQYAQSKASMLLEDFNKKKEDERM